MPFKKKTDSMESETNPWNNDVLERKGLAEKLTKLLDTLNQPFVLSLASGYGTGKTYFIRNWRRDLQGKEGEEGKKGYFPVYFNAWEEDHADDAFVAFVAAIKTQLPEAAQRNEAQKCAWEDTLKEGSKVLAKGVASKLLTSEAVSKLCDTMSISEDDMGDKLGNLAANAISHHQQASSAVEQFREALKRAVETLPPKPKTSETETQTQGKLVVFVDELDRCRPNYAIQVLERIKHFFHVEGVVFILAMDTGQLRNAVASVYGGQVDGEEYLRKFIDLQLALPKPDSYSFAEMLWDDFQLNEMNDRIQCFHWHKDQPEMVFGLCAEAFDLTLREQAQCLTAINLVVRTANNGKHNGWLLMLMPILQMREAEALKNWAAGDMSPEEITQTIKDKIARNASSEDWFSNVYLEALFLDGKKRRAPLLTA